MSNELIIKILNYIDECLYTKISIDELSSIYYFNKDYIMRLFKKELGITIIMISHDNDLDKLLTLISII